jgi:hypothetical protein
MNALSRLIGVRLLTGVIFRFAGLAALMFGVSGLSGRIWRYR